MRYSRWAFSAVLSAIALAGCASSGASPKDLATAARYEVAAGDPVPSFRFTRIDRFTVVDDAAIAVWDGNRRAWLLTVESPCPELRWSLTVGLGDGFRRVYVNTDDVFFSGLSGEKDHCRIRSIRPLDVAALRASELKSQQTQDSGKT